MPAYTETVNPRGRARRGLLGRSDRAWLPATRLSSAYRARTPMFERAWRPVSPPARTPASGRVRRRFRRTPRRRPSRARPATIARAARVPLRRSAWAPPSRMARRPTAARRRGTRSACRPGRRPAPAPPEAVPLHDGDEAQVLVRLRALRVAARVEVDREAPGVERQGARGGDAARGIAAGVVAGVDEVGEAAADEVAHRRPQRRDHRAVARDRADHRHAGGTDVAADPRRVGRGPVRADRQAQGGTAQAPPLGARPGHPAAGGPP